MTDVIEEIRTERSRQREEEGFDTAHDDQWTNGQIARASAAYALGAGTYHPDRSDPPRWWPWNFRWWKPRDRRYDLIRAAALIVAEIERLDRAALERDKL